MAYHPDIHHRRSIRLKGYDYSKRGAYFVTICTHERECLFGEVVDGAVRLSEAGRIVTEEWIKTAEIRPEIEMEAWVVMPNHFHAIVIMPGRGTACRAPNDIAPDGVAQDGVTVGSRGVTVGLGMGRGTARRAPTVERFGVPVTGSLPTVMRSFKSAVTKRINELRNTPGVPAWQRNYYERVIRNDRELAATREYIANNPAQWDRDTDNPKNLRVPVGAGSKPARNKHRK